MTRNFFPSVSRMRRIRSRAEGAEGGRGGRGKNASGPVSPGDGWARMPVQGLSGPHESCSSVFTRDRHFLLRGPTNERGQSLDAEWNSDEQITPPRILTEDFSSFYRHAQSIGLISQPSKSPPPSRGPIFNYIRRNIIERICTKGELEASTITVASFAGREEEKERE